MSGHSAGQLAQFGARVRAASSTLGWPAFGAILVVATVLAARAPVLAQPGSRLDEEGAHEIFQIIAHEEPGMRATAAHAFPGDVWSQDDDFHALERKKVRSFAAEHDVPIADVVRAVDDGMREGWSPRGVLSAKVPPCRPRLDY